MNIVLLNHYAGSPELGMEFRPYYLARAWAELGHSVTIVGANFSHVRHRQPGRPGRAVVETRDGVRWVWLPTPQYSGNGAARFVNMLAYVAGVLARRNLVTGGARPDVVIASSTYPLDIVAARALARRARAGLVFEVHDLWPLTPMELGGLSARHPFIRVMQWAEDTAYRDAHAVVSLLPNTLAHMQGRGMDARKFSHIPNGIDIAGWEGAATPLPEAHAAELARLRRQGKLVVGYAGSHGLANALDTLLEAADRLRDERVAFVLVGQGPEKDALLAQARARGLEDVVFLPSVPRAAVPALLACFDVGAICWRRSPLYRFGISPNKLMDYMMAGLPIVHAVDAPNDLVAVTGCGLSVPAEDAAALAQAIRALAAMPPCERSAMGARGAAYVRAELDYRVLAARFAAILDDARAAARN